MIADRDTDAPQGHREGIGARDVTGPILTLEEPGAPLSLLGQLDQSLGFANIAFFGRGAGLGICSSIYCQRPFILQKPCIALRYFL